MSLQPFSAEELPAVKAWKRCFLTELGTHQPLLIFFFLFGRMTVQPEVSFFCYFIMTEQSTGHVQVKYMAFSKQVHFLIHIFETMSNYAYGVYGDGETKKCRHNKKQV